MNALTAATWTLQHEDGTQIRISPRVSLSLAHDSGYRWLNRNDNMGWRHLPVELRKAACRAACGVSS